MFILNKTNKLFKIIKNKTWRKGLLRNIAANIELENLVKDLNFETVIDVGSNKGQFILLIEGIYKNKKIFSFEPIEYILKKQIEFFKNNKNIFFYNFALGSNSKFKKFYITKRKDSSSFLKVENSKNKDFKIIEEKNVEIKTLDETFSKINLISPILLKIDVQGFELEVLKGLFFSDNFL